MKVIALLIFVMGHIASAAPVATEGSPTPDTFDQTSLYRIQKTYPAIYQGSRFLKWDGDEVHQFTKQELQMLSRQRATAICQIFGFKEGTEGPYLNVPIERNAPMESWVPRNNKLELMTPSKSGSQTGNAWRSVTIIGAFFIDDPVYFKSITCMK